MTLVTDPSRVVYTSFGIKNFGGTDFILEPVGFSTLAAPHPPGFNFPLVHEMQFLRRSSKRGLAFCAIPPEDIIAAKFGSLAHRAKVLYTIPGRKITFENLPGLSPPAAGERHRAPAQFVRVRPHFYEEAGPEGPPRVLPGYQHAPPRPTRVPDTRQPEP